MCKVSFWFPSVIRGRVAFPFDEVLSLFTSCSMTPYGLNFVFFFIIDYFWGIIREVGSVNIVFLKRFQEGGMESVVDLPCCREF